MTALTLLNPDFDLKTFYWFYSKSDSTNRPTVVTYTAAFYDTSKEMHTNDTVCTPYLLIECKPLTGEISWSQPEQDEYTVDPRVIEAIKKHFSYEFMFSDGVILSAEYAQDADNENCRLHSHPEFGQAIFGSDLEELYDNR